MLCFLDLWPSSLLGQRSFCWCLAPFWVDLHQSWFGNLLGCIAISILCRGRFDIWTDLLLVLVDLDFAFQVGVHNKIWIVHFTVVYLVTWPLSESEAGVDLILIQTHLLFILKYKLVSMRRTWFTCESRRSLSKQGQLQPHFHSKARSLSTQL